MPDVFVKVKDAEKKVHPVTIMNEQPGKLGLFSTFTPLPRGIHFENQENEETIILIIRRHWVTNIPWLAAGTFFSLLPPLAIPFISVLLSTVFPFPLPATYGIVLTALYYLLISGFLLIQYATWFYNIGVITNFRIIDIDFTSLMNRNISYTDLVDIVDVDVIQAGFMQTIFDYGNVLIQTEGLKANFEFSRVPKSNKVADVISDLTRHSE